MLCVINLADYTRPNRGRILYNHLYFYTFQIFPKHTSWRYFMTADTENILRHRNYSPRVIDYMIQARHACTVVPSLCLAEFTNSLENPVRVWIMHSDTRSRGPRDTHYLYSVRCPTP